MHCSLSNLVIGFSWVPGDELLHQSPPSALASSAREQNPLRPQLARDEKYASAIINAWKDEVSSRSIKSSPSVSAPYVYSCKEDRSSALYGYIYRASPPSQLKLDDNSLATTQNNNNPPLLPGVILFHTGAGPQDLFLRWKADSLVNSRDVFGDGGCIVLIADILGDDSGWAWNDRVRYEAVRNELLEIDEYGCRRKLIGRVQAAIDAISSQPGVDQNCIGALGFCLGGQPILELAKMKNPSVKVMVTFHGVFDGVSVGRLDPIEDRSANDVTKYQVLVCTGADDPFVSTDDLDASMTLFRHSGYQSQLLKFEKTRHGFTNPAQDYNPSDAFAYNEEAHYQAWSATLSLLKEMKSG